MGGVSGPTDDSLDRFDRVLDQQLDAIEDIDQKAEHVTRFVTLVLGVVLSVASVLSRIDPAAFDPGWASIVEFSMPILGLVGAVAGAILTEIRGGSPRLQPWEESDNPLYQPRAIVPQLPNASHGFYKELL